jgi:hypothetical protein
VAEAPLRLSVQSHDAERRSISQSRRGDRENRPPAASRQHGGTRKRKFRRPHNQKTNAIPPHNQTPNTKKAQKTID